MTTPSGWPRIKAYREAVQAPEHCFADADLRKAVIQKTPGGFPLVAAGRSAVVFKATVDTRTVAIRCFTRAASDQELRYRALQEHVQAAPPPYFVGFAYRDREIWVDNGRYPLVVMDWVEGRPLNDWVHEHLGQGRYLIDQAQAWLFMAGDMLSRGLAHGDIANDNCLVAKDQLKLIDYDGCYLPGLADKHPGESGAQHFQHPRRNGYYAGDMDAFPNLVVFLSLLALQDDPSLWNRFYIDKNLIFRDIDFEAPGRTPIWAALSASQDSRVRTLTAALATMCQSPVGSLPSLPQVAHRAAIDFSPGSPRPSGDEPKSPRTPGEDREPWYLQPEFAERRRRHSATRQAASQETGPLPGTDDDGQPTVSSRPARQPANGAEPVISASAGSVRRRWRQRHPVIFVILILLAVAAVTLVIGLVAHG